MTMRRAFPGSPTGFSLLELLVVIGIILLLASLSAGLFMKVARSQRFRDSVERVAQTLALARSLAIQENAIIHVRVENQDSQAQSVSVYRFPRIADALQATSEEEVQTNLGGWRQISRRRWEYLQAYPQKPTNYFISQASLKPGSYFETQYTPDLVWDASRDRNRLKRSESIHADENFMFYSGKWTDDSATYKALTTDGFNLLPKTATYTSAGDLDGTAEATLLYFNPDGSASAFVTLFIRDRENLGFVQVWKGGHLRTGSITQRSGFAQLELK